MKTKPRVMVSLSLLAACLLAVRTLPYWPGERSGAAKSLPTAWQPQQADLGNGNQLKLDSRKVGRARVVQTPEAVRLAAKAFQNNGAVPEVTSLAAKPAKESNAHDTPPAPVLSDAQQKNLSRLRWGLSKDLRYRGDSGNATVRFLSASVLAKPVAASGNPTELAAAFVAENRALFLLQDPAKELNALAAETDQLGGSVVRFQQTYGGLEVWPARITANTNRAGILTSVTGAYVPTPSSLSLSPDLNADTALDRAAVHLGLAGAKDAQVHSPATLKIFAPKGRTPELSYECILEAGNRHERVFVSAKTGGVLLAISEICTGATMGSGKDVSGQSKSLNVYSEGSPARYYLYDTSKPMYRVVAGEEIGFIAILDGSKSEELPISSSFPTSGFDAEGVSGAFNLGKAYDFYKQEFARDSYDGNGASLIGVVKKTNDDGTTMDNAYWHNGVLAFGSADNWVGSVDVIGHELTHAVVEKTAGLVYANESGAINESFADIMGESLERYLSGAQDWLFGSSLSPTNSVGGPYRSLKSPNLSGQGYQPSSMSQFIRTTEDNGGVHINSGIPNHAFYLLAEGLSSGGIGFIPARNIFYRALTTKLNSNSDFHDLRDACVASAEELFGAGSTQASKTALAFNEVEIFDRTFPTASSDLTPVSGSDSLLATELYDDGYYYLGRGESTLGDDLSNLKKISPYAVSPDTRLSISGDGRVAAYISADHDLVVVETLSGSAKRLNLPGNFNSAALSQDGLHIALILRDPNTSDTINQINYLDTKTGKSTTIDLYLPVIDGPSTLQITAIDEIDISPDGQIAVFDALAETKLTTPSGGIDTISAWSLFAVDLSTHDVFVLGGPFDGLNIGNPAFARTSASRIAFDFELVDNSGTRTSSGICTVNLSNQDSLAIISQYTPASEYPGFPSFSPADDGITYTETDYIAGYAYPRLAARELLSDKLTGTGDAVALVDFTHAGLIYRRGTFVGVPKLAVAARTSSVVGGNTSAFRISRVGGDTTIPVPVTFKAIGTARPLVDYAKINLTVTLPANQTYVDVPVSCLLAPGESTRQLTLSLDPQSYHLLDPTAKEATMALTAPALTYAHWASTYGAGSATADDDGDGFNNFLEYVLGANPKSTTQNYLSSEVIEIGLQRFIQLRVDRSQIVPGLSWTLQRSANRSIWNTAAYAIVANTDSELILRDSLPLSTNETRYLRIQFNDSIGTATTASLGRANLSLGNLTQVYNGTPRSVSVTGVPNGFTPTVAYDDSITPPTNAGYYLVDATIDSNGLIAEASEILTILPASQTIGFTTPSSATYGQAPIVLSATASSGLPVTLNVESGPAVISNSTLSLTGAGTVFISASQDGDENYDAAESVFQFIIVSKASQTITFNPPSSVPFSGSATNLSATASSGLPVAFAVVSGPGTLTGSLLTVTGPGSILIRSTQAGDDNYLSATPVQKTITVANAPQNITFAPIADRTFNPAGNTFTLSASATSGLAVNLSVTSGPATVSGNTLTITGAGSVTVQASQAGNADYASASATRTFIVAKASQTIAFAAPADRQVGAPAFDLAATSTSGLPVAFSVSGPASLAGNTLTLSGTTGIVTVTASQTGDSNYNPATAVERTFTVSAAPQTVNFTPIDNRTFNPAANTLPLSATASSGLSPIDFSVISGPATVAGNTLTITGAGSITVQASQAGNANYGAATATRTFTVAKASQSIVFNAPSTASYGNAPLSLSASASSGLQVAFSVVSGPGNLNGSLLTVTGPGYVLIRATQAGDANYTAASPVERTIAVANAPQTVDFAPIADRTFNPASSSLTLSANATSGLTVSFSVTSGPATVAGNTLTITGAGSVTVRASQAGNADYASATATRTFTVAKAQQTIAFTAPANAQVGAPAFNLAATATSGLPVVFSVSGPASLSGNLLTLSGTTGIVTVTASQTGDSNYNPATAVERTFTVSAAPQTVNFTPIDNRTFNPAANTLPLSATASSGLSPIDFSVISGPATVAGNTLTVTGAGSITVQASQAGNANYGAATATRTFTVAKASQTIVFNAPSTASYGNAPLSLSASASSGLPVAFSVASGPATVNGVSLTFNGAGSVVIRASQSGDLNYLAATEVFRGIPVSKAPLTVSAQNRSRLVGTANPALALSYSGLVGSDTPTTALTKAPVAATKADAKSAPGNYPITLTGGASNNYALTLVPGTLTVVGFGGTYEALLLDQSSVPVGKLSLTIPAAALSYTGTLTLAREVKAIPIASTSKSTGTTAFAGSVDLAAATWTRTATTTGLDALALAVTVSADGSLTGSLKRKGQPSATLAYGSRLRVFAKGQTALGAGANTLVLHPADNLSNSASRPFPSGSGFATAPIAATTGVLTLKGNIADGSPLTASLKPTLDDTYLLWVNPYGTRADSFLAGALPLQGHPEKSRFPGRAYIPRDAGLLTWQKAASPAKPLDKSYRAGFGPLSVEVSLDPWLPPATKAAGAIPAGTLAQRLGLAANATTSGALTIAHGPDALDLGARESLLPLAASLSPAGVFTATNAAATAWTIKLTPTTGAFTGSFTLSDQIAQPPAKPVTRLVTFSGVLRQAPAGDRELGAGFFLVPGFAVPKGAVPAEQPSGEIRFSAP